MGHVSSSLVRSNKTSFRYVTKYLFKANSMMKSSRNPGIGSTGLIRLGSALARANPDTKRMPSTLTIEGKKYPLDQQIRTYINRGYYQETGRTLQIGNSPITNDLVFKVEDLLRVPVILPRTEYNHVKA